MLIEATTMNYWQPSELLQVLATARKQSSRNHCLILLAYKHGLRSQEICNLRLSDVQHGRIDVQRLKGSLHTNRPLESDTNVLLDEKRALQEWLRDRGDADGSVFLFTSRQGSGLTRRSVYNIFDHIACRARIEPGRRNPHMAKHTLGALAYRSGVDVAALQQLLGDKDPKATLCYTHVTQDEAHQKGRIALGRMFVGEAAA
jgi:type 1 fimbriae regulatory protein FimE